MIMFGLTLLVVGVGGDVVGGEVHTVGESVELSMTQLSSNS